MATSARAIPTFDAELDRWVGETEAARIRGCTRSLLQKERWLGIGPEYAKDGRAVRYKVRTLINYMENLTRSQSRKQQRTRMTASNEGIVATSIATVDVMNQCGSIESPHPPANVEF